MVYDTVLSQFACQASKQQIVRGILMPCEESVTHQTGTNGTQSHTQAAHDGTAI